MRVAVVGVGGVGGYFGARLLQAGEDVALIARGDHLRALRAAGLTVEDGQGHEFTVQPSLATDSPGEVGEVDVILVGVKAWQVPDAAEEMRPMVGPRTLVVPLQNGIEAPAQLAAVLGEEHVAGGLCGLISYRVGPGRIRTLNLRGSIQVRELAPGQGDRVKELASALSRTQNVNVMVPPDIRVALWNKFVLIAPWSGVGAITRAPLGVFRSLPETRALLEQAVQEVHAVGRAHRIDLPGDTVQRTLDALDRVAPEGTASMQRDIMAGRPSELEAQNGAVVRYGRAAGVDTPVNRLIYHSLLPLERRARGQANWIDPE